MCRKTIDLLHRRIDAIEQKEKDGMILWDVDRERIDTYREIVQLLREEESESLEQEEPEIPVRPAGEFSHLFFDESGKRRLGRRKGASA